ncbi:MAG TPA: hypothetical protein VK766_00655, partial [Cytophagaceae bacterium]|nr:hypothetical protein [Cytophagaceae bacterium]
LEPVKVVIDQFTKNLYNFTVESNSYYALDKFVTTEIQVNTTYSYLFLSVLAVAIIFIITTISYLDLYWFMGGMLGFLLFLFSMKIEMLELFGRVDRVPMVSIFMLYGGISFIFNSYYKSVSYLVRLLVFMVITGLVGFVCYQYSSVASPFLYLANFGSLFPLWISVVFIFVIGYDNIMGFLYIVSSKKTIGSKNSLLNFIFASLLYLLNVLLLLLKKLYILELDIVYINPFLLLSISTILGIWMFKKRSEMFSSVLPFAPAGAYVYLSLALITFSGIAYAFINGNIGIIEAYERIIVYGHLFLGVVFFVYVLVNFIFLFDKKISIYEIVYQPLRMTFLAVPAIAITISIFFFLYQKKFPYNLAMSGYYTYAGDVMSYEGQYPLAFQYYQKAVSFDYPNHRANYAIAFLASSLNDKETAKGYFENALFRDPTIQSYVGLSNLYMETGELFKAMFKVQEGLLKFPENGRLYNNLAVLFLKSNMEDSAIHYFLKSKQLMEEKQQASSNILYLLAKRGLFNEADSIIATDNYPEYISFVNNKLTISNQLGKKETSSYSIHIKDSILNANTYAFLVNRNLNSLKDSAQSELDELNKFSTVSSNDAYKDNLACQVSLRNYYSGDRLAAIQEMLILNSNTVSSADYSAILGDWMLEQDQYTMAADFFKSASKSGNQNNQVNFAIASSLADQQEEALLVFYQLTNAEDSTVRSIALKWIKILSVKNIQEALSLDEMDRLHYFLVLIQKKNLNALNTLYNSFTNEQVKIYASIALCRYYWEENNNGKAKEVFALVKNGEKLNGYVEKERNYMALLLSTTEKDLNYLKEKSKIIPLNSDRELLRDYFMAVSYELEGNNKEAISYYLKTLKGAPFVEFAVARSVSYLSKHGKQTEAYNYLVDILQINSSSSMQKAYLELCIEMTLISYAESTLHDLKPNLTKAEYLEYQERLLKIQN